MPELRYHRPARCAFLVVSLLLSSVRVGANESVALLLSDVAHPYRTVLDQIAEGVAKGAGSRLTRFQMNDAQALPPGLSHWLDAGGDSGRVLVCLGESAVRAAQAIDKTDTHLVVGAVLNLPEGAVSGVSLIPDPEVTFGYLSRLAPRVRTVHVVIAEGVRHPQLTRAMEVSQAMGFELSVRTAGDFHEAAAVFRNLLPSLGPSDSIWVGSDRRVFDDAIMLPLLLKEAWARDLVLFSDSLAHVSRGALFAPFPDNGGLGETLATLALDLAASSQEMTETSRKLFLTDTHLAINTRALRHLNLILPPDLVAQVRLRFPRE